MGNQPRPWEAKKKILKILKENPDERFWFSKLAEETSMSESTVSKYAKKLEEEFKVKIEEEGRLKLVKLPKGGERKAKAENLAKRMLKGGKKTKKIRRELMKNPLDYSESQAGKIIREVEGG